MTEDEKYLRTVKVGPRQPTADEWAFLGRRTMPDDALVDETCKVGEEIEKACNDADAEAEKKRLFGPLQRLPAFSDIEKLLSDRVLPPWDLQAR